MTTSRIEQAQCSFLTERQGCIPIRIGCVDIEQVARINHFDAGALGIPGTSGTPPGQVNEASAEASAAIHQVKVRVLPGSKSGCTTKASMPTCVPASSVDISNFIEQRHLSLMAYRSHIRQPGGRWWTLCARRGDSRAPPLPRRATNGLLAGVRYGEPFVQKEVGLVDDLTLVPVQSI